MKCWQRGRELDAEVLAASARGVSWEAAYFEKVVPGAQQLHSSALEVHYLGKESKIELTSK